MMFNRLALIKAAEDEIAAQMRAEKQHANNENAKRDAEATEWYEQYGQAWLDVLGTLRRKLRAGMPVYTSDLPLHKDWRSSIAVFGDKPRPPATARPVELPELRNLIAVLSAVSDDVVSTSGLASIGITSRALRSTIQRLGRAERED